MSRKKQIERIMHLRHWAFAVVFILFAVVLAASSLQFRTNARLAKKAEAVTAAFTYEISSGESGEATFPHSFKNLAPHTGVTALLPIEPGQYESLLVKTVYSGLKLYADDVLIYECGQENSYPKWMLDPPTLLSIVPVPKEASLLRFEYISPTQRSTMTAPALMAGNDAELLAYMFGQNSALLSVSALMLLLGLVSVVLSLFFWRFSEAGKPFFSLGLFAFAVGCWGLGECNATAFLIPYPVLLYCMAMVGLASFVIPLLSFGLLILRPKNPLPMTIARTVLKVTLVSVLALQLFGIKALSATLPIIQILAVLGVVVFTAVTAWEHFKHKNPAARWFALPSLTLMSAALLEYWNYSARFTDVLSLLLLTGTLLFALMLGMIGIWNARKLMKEAETAKDAAKKLAFMHQMSHDLLTPLTRVSTNVQMAGFAPETAGERLAEAQADVMAIAGMVNRALADSKEGEAP